MFRSEDGESFEGGDETVVANFAPAAEAVGLLTAEQARRYGVVPLRAGAAAVELLAAEELGHEASDELVFLLGREVRVTLAEPAAVRATIERHYGRDAAENDALLSELDGVEILPETEEKLSERELAALAAQAPVVRYVNLVLAQAVRDRASDVHFEPFEREFRIRYRIDGVLHELRPPAKSLALPIASRLKVLANLDIAERRLPQDGRIRTTLAGRSVDLRVSTLPTQFGESVVLRVLDRSAVGLKLSDLGMPEDVRAGVEEMVRRPNGIFIVTGPTGSGKTTTLYRALRSINDPAVKILTIEDPVEYQIDGVMQVPVNLAAGLTFASALRSFLRQDPDVIMVGEIRDTETAQVAIQAALTGHLVLTTLHTNDAAGAVTRLIDMGIEPFLIASTVEAVLAQRLVRRLCPDCRVDSPEGTKAGGCERCGQTGFRGRRGIFEWLGMTEALRELVSQRAPAGAIREAAIAGGMRTLASEGRRLVAAGETTVGEMAKYI